MEMKTFFVVSVATVFGLIPGHLGNEVFEDIDGIDSIFTAITSFNVFDKIEDRLSAVLQKACDKISTLQPGCNDKQLFCYSEDTVKFLQELCNDLNLTNSSASNSEDTLTGSHQNRNSSLYEARNGSARGFDMITSIFTSLFGSLFSVAKSIGSLVIQQVCAVVSPKNVTSTTEAAPAGRFLHRNSWYLQKQARNEMVKGWESSLSTVTSMFSSLFGDLQKYGEWLKKLMEWFPQVLRAAVEKATLLR